MLLKYSSLFNKSTIFWEIWSPSAFLSTETQTISSCSLPSAPVVTRTIGVGLNFRMLWDTRYIINSYQVNLHMMFLDARILIWIASPRDGHPQDSILPYSILPSVVVLSGGPFLPVSRRASMYIHST